MKTKTVLPVPLDTRMEVETPEHVLFHYRVAGPGPRGIAWMIDAGFRVILLTIVALAVAIIGWSLGMSGGSFGMVMVVWFLVDWGWYTVADAMLEGQTPGRMIVGLRVIRLDGGPVGWREAILRNLLRPADALPFGYAVGAVVATMDRRFRRLGDLVAGTVVVHTGRATVVPERLALPEFPEAQLATVPSRLRLPIQTQSALEGWLQARERLGPVWAYATADRLRAGFVARYRVSAVDPVRLLELLVWSGRQGAQEAPDLASARQLADLRGQRTLAPEEAGRLVRAYRSICAEVGRLRGRLVQEQLAPLEEIAAAGHARLYRQSARWMLPRLREVAEVLIFDFPAEVRRQRTFVLVAAGLFLLPMAVAGLMATGSSEFVDAVLPVSMRVQMEAAYSQPISRSASDNAAMAGFYVFNNVGIALRSIGAGLFFGIGTAWVLVYNGLLIGTVAGHLSAQGMGWNLLRFVSGHSAWELTALVLAGAAGLRLGWSLVDTGGRTRMGSLRAVGPSLTIIAGGAAVMLGVAAAVEGFWSGQELPDAARAVFAAANALVVAGWLIFQRRA